MIANMMAPYWNYIIGFAAGLFVATVVVLIVTIKRRGRPSKNAEALRLNLLRGAYRILEEDWSAAIEEFRSVVRDDPEKIDTYFVLGRLFRKTGQHQRAILVHQNLIIQNDLDDDNLKHRAQFELAEDYVAANLPRRGLAVFLELVEQAPRWVEPWERLLELAMPLNDWAAAARAVRRLEKLTGEDRSDLLAHVLAELALHDIETKEPDAARAYLKDALQRAPRSAHVAQAFARYHNHKGKPKPAIKALKEALASEPAAAAILLDEFRRIAVAAEHPEWIDTFLQEQLDGECAFRLSTRVQQAIRLREQGEESKAREAIRALLVDGATTPAILAEVKRLQLTLPDSSVHQEKWTCSNCGETRIRLGWFCPKCQAWATYFPDESLSSVESKS